MSQMVTVFNLHERVFLTNGYDKVVCGPISCK